MIVSCPGCQKKYRIPDEKIGDKPKKIRCRNCSTIIVINPQAAESPAGAAQPARKAAEAPDAIRRDDTYTRARRLARVLASDMLIYNRELVEQAKREGNLPSAMGAEIKRSWDLWSSRFSREIVEGTNLFREALNEVLAGGDDLFSDWTP
ncbi:zinc-ribbon domain-containing protein [Candidatus Fermentibacterales bacterium]|nr:zinc-ribbon domain-containing protein [Candidatus Fermentibacterales bacterium]